MTGEPSAIVPCAIELAAEPVWQT